MPDDLKRSLLRLRLVHFQGVVAQMYKASTGRDIREAWVFAAQLVGNLMSEHKQIVDPEHLAMYEEMAADATRRAREEGLALEATVTSASWPGVTDEKEAPNA